MTRTIARANPSMRNLLRRLFKFLVYFALGSVAVVVVLRWVPPPGSMLMVERKVQSWFNGQPIDLQRDWRSWDSISDNLKVAVIAGEDQKFAEHHGFDLPAIEQALAHNGRGKSLRGASTISQQTAKNLFLWNGRSFVRKGLEAYFTVLLELTWPKRRILEVYMNIAELGDGVYGVGAASEIYFNEPPARLGPSQAARLAAVLPSPRRLHADRPSAYVLRRADWIERQMRQLGGPSYIDGRR